MRFIGLFLLVILTGCSQNKVHLYSRYLSAEQSNQLTTQLQDAGFTVQVNHLPFPDTLQQSALVYGVPYQHPAAIDQVRLIAQAAGWPLPHVSAIVSGNHSFTGNQIGLFLLPAGIELNAAPTSLDLAAVYQSQNCQSQPELTLSADQRFVIKPATPNGATTRLLTGRWQMREYPYLELQAEDDPDWFYYLEIGRDQTRDATGIVQLITLTPMYSYPVFAGCQLSYGVRN